MGLHELLNTLAEYLMIRVFHKARTALSFGFQVGIERLPTDSELPRK
jgi:hypothetical protein